MSKPVWQLPPPPAEAPEHEKARWWREHKMNWSRPQLAHASGFSVRRIVEFETGATGGGRKLAHGDYHRYRLICGALSAGVGFDWVSTTTTPIIGMRVEQRPGRLTIELDV